MRKLVLALALTCSLFTINSAQTSAARVQQREAEWKSYPLPASNFRRLVATEKQFVLRIPADWKQTGANLTFSGPNSSVINVLTERVPDGLPLTDYVAAFMSALSSISGAEPPLIRRVQFQDLEARELMIETTNPEGEMMRNTSWVTVIGPVAVTFNFQTPVANAHEMEPLFKALVQSVIFVRSFEFERVETLRSSIKNTTGPVNEIETLVDKTNELNAHRKPIVERLVEIASTNPDQTIDLLLDRRPLVREVAVEALTRIDNSNFENFFWDAIRDSDSLIAERAARRLAASPDVVTKLLEYSSFGFQTDVIARAWPWIPRERRVELLKTIFSQTAVRPAAPTQRENKPPVSVSVSKLEPITPGKPIHFDAALLSPQDPNVQLGALTLMVDMPVEDFKLPLNRLMDANFEPLVIVGLQVANKRAEQLDLSSVLKLSKSSNPEIKQLALENLKYSAGLADIPRIEALREKTRNDSKPTEIDKALDQTIKAIRFRSELETRRRSGGSLTELIKKGLTDSDIADFVWQNASRENSQHSFKSDIRLLPLGENIFPNRVSHYAAILNPRDAIQKFYESLNGIQMNSARGQSNLFMMMGNVRQILGRSLYAPLDAEALIDYTGIKSDSPIALTQWTAQGAIADLPVAKRKAILLQVSDRERFERSVVSYQASVGDFTALVDYVAGGARLIAALPAVLPFSAQQFGADEAPAKKKTPSLLQYSTSHSITWNGLDVKVLEKRELDSKWQLVLSSAYIAYVGNKAIIAPDLSTLAELLERTRDESGKDHLGTNEEFQQVVARGGEVIYFSDLNSLITGIAGQTSDAPTDKLKESGNLRILPSSWENSHQLLFEESDWSKDLKEFQPQGLVAPRDLLPASTIAYYFMMIDMANGWESLSKNLPGTRQSDISATFGIDFKTEVLPELGPECGLALLQLPDLSNLDQLTWTGFCHLKSNKLVEALTSGKLLKGIAVTNGVAEIKTGAESYFVTTKNNFLVVSNRREGIEKLGDKSNLVSTRDYNSATEKVPAGIVAFGGYNLSAAVAAVKIDNQDGQRAQIANVIFSLANAFHGQNFYAMAKPGSLEARSSVAMDRQGRFAVSDLSFSSHGTNISYATLEPHGIPIADQKRITSLVLKISSNTTGPIEDILDDVKTEGQTVEQKSPTELLLTVGSRRGGTDAKIQLPIADPALAEFLKPTTEITSKDRDVVERAHEIAGNDKDAWSVALKLSAWIHKNLEWRFTAQANPSETLATREADCSEFSELFISMARSLGLPARMVSGIAFGGNSFGGHAWVEVWVGRWIELDPTWGTDYVDATHIRNKSTALVSSAALNLIDVEVLAAKRTEAEFQKTPEALARELSKGLATSDVSTIEAALDLETITDEFMAPGELEKMSNDERSDLLAGFRRVEREIMFGFDQKDHQEYRFIHLDEKDGLAQAYLMTANNELVKLRLRNRRGNWYLVDIEQTLTGLHIVEETVGPIIRTIKTNRSGSKERAPRSEFIRAILLLDTKPDKATEIIDSALKNDPKNQRLRFLKAQALILTKKSDDAIKLLTELSDEKPAYAPAVFKLASMLSYSQQKENLDRAPEYSRKYVALEPYDPNGHQLLAETLSVEKNLDQAESEFRKALEYDTDSWVRYYNLVYFLLENDRTSSLSNVFAIAEKHPTAGVDVFGSIMESLRFDESELGVKLAINQPDRLKKSYLGTLNLAKIYVEEDEPLKALPLLNLALQLDRKAAAPHISIATANRALHRWPIALRAIDRALVLDPKNAAAYYERACTLARLGRLNEAMKALTTAVEFEPSWAYIVADEKDLKPLSSLPALKKILADVEKETETKNPN